MDPLCHTCEPPVPSSLFCEICDKHLCSTCCGEHLLDESTEHKVVVFKKRKTTIKCKKHSSKICKLFCEQCNIPICPLCTASKEHQTHIVDDIMKSLVNKKTVFQKDLQELESSIYPKCQELASKIPVQKDSRNKNSEKVKEAINIFGENLHKDIDYMIEKLKSELNELDSKDLDLLNKQEDKIRRIISEIIKSIADLKKVRNSNDASLISSYKSRNTELRKLPPKLSVSLPRFTYRKIDKEQLYQHLCLLLMCSIEKEESGYITYSPRSELSFLDRPFIEVPWILAEIMSENQYSFCGSCLNDGEIWISGSDISGKGIMSLYGHRREVMKSIQTNSGELPGDLAVTQNRELVYTDYHDKTVNMGRFTPPNSIIVFQGWRPRGLCVTPSSELLVVIDSDETCTEKQTKVVRYSNLYIETQSIQYDDEGKAIFSPGGQPKFISENRNLDICVSDSEAHAIVVVNQVGKLRFTYTGHPSINKKPFYPHGITTDSQCRILTTDYNNHLIHILDQNGQFLRFIDNCDLRYPYGLCLDYRGNLFVVECLRSMVKKIQYCK
eukprot:XP_011438426.1 PREDICTED: uncharacterized protein LOC105335973 [Crassostrea gigas]